ncbi:MAG TPA: adenosylcobinamide-phosphate synthase CbiB [Acidimicrobiia bacterium]|nr:adenosylcobinamide-phosphate synthase CbiB [Acidimicrobiia bacterium]
MTGSGRLAGAAIGLFADRLLGEPPQLLHPVAAFGRAMTALEHAVYADDRRVGVGYAALGVGAGALAGRVAGSTAVVVALSSSGRMLRQTARTVGVALDRGDVEGARELLPALVGRDPAALDASGIAAATVESVAENTVDAVVAPALFGALLGASGAAAHRAVNTLDAMVGHPDDRYGRFGWAGARLDDLAAYVPARVTALLVCAARPARAANVVSAVRRDAPGHPSPNAGVAEAAFAAALGVELGGPTRYPTHLEERPRLGTGPRPAVADIERAARLADRVEWLLIALLLVAARATRASRITDPTAADAAPTSKGTS